MTRYEKIRSLSLDDMASFLARVQWDSSEPSTQEMHEWLSQDYTSDNNDMLYLATDGLQMQIRKTNRQHIAGLTSEELKGIKDRCFLCEKCQQALQNKCLGRCKEHTDNWLNKPYTGLLANGDNW